ncbi:MAG: hypothetical protein ACI837_002028 [Crocinitomicaceae bacterium]|jgi:hypothetical protein
MKISAFYGSLYPPGSQDTPKLSGVATTIKNSGFNTVIFSLIHIGSPVNCWTNPAGKKECQVLGDLIYNNTDVNHVPDRIATNGAVVMDYVGIDPTCDWAHYMTEMKTGGVEKIYLSIGGGSPVADFTTIATDIMEYQIVAGKKEPYIPTDSDLYKNFAALRKYLPMVDGIDLDQEEGTDQSMIDAMIAVGNMAIIVGFKEITITPPFDYYLDCYQAAGEAINTFASNNAGNKVNGAVSRIQLQLYSGIYTYPKCMTTWEATAKAIGAKGGGANPILAVGANANGKDEAALYADFNQYSGNYGSGGFVWQYGFMASNLAQYYQAMERGLTGGSWPPASS